LNTSEALTICRSLVKCKTLIQTALFWKGKWQLHKGFTAISKNQ
jgi:hypothetical protein